MAAGWTAAETRALIGVWGAADVQRQLDGVVRNRTIYERVARDLQALGYSHTWEQCRTKQARNTPLSSGGAKWAEFTHPSKRDHEEYTLWVYVTLLSDDLN